MIKSIGLSVALLSIALLMSSVSASARTGETFVPVPGSAAQINAVASAVNPSQVLSLWGSAIYTGGDGGKQYGNGDGKKWGDGDGNEGGDDDGGDDDGGSHNPTPEPSTILSFGAAILIGGGVLYSRRLRRNRK